MKTRTTTKGTNRPTQAQQRRRRQLVRRGWAEGRWSKTIVTVGCNMASTVSPILNDQEWVAFLNEVDRRFVSGRAEVAR